MKNGRPSLFSLICIQIRRGHCDLSPLLDGGARRGEGETEGTRRPGGDTPSCWPVGGEKHREKGIEFRIDAGDSVRMGDSFPPILPRLSPGVCPLPAITVFPEIPPIQPTSPTSMHV